MDALKRNIWMTGKSVFGMLLMLLLAGCFGTPKISLDEASFDIMPPPSINGVGRHVTRDSLTRYWGGVGYGMPRHFSGKVHKGSADFPVEYELSSFSIFGDYRAISSNEKQHQYGGGFGFYPYPYFYLFASHGYKHAEIGTYALTSISVEKVSYVGMAKDAPTTYKEYVMGDFDPEFTRITDEYNIHGNLAAGLFLNIFMGNITLSYIPSLYSPWAYFDGFGDKGYDPSVWFPFLMIQDFQVAYNYSRWSVGASLTNIVSNVLSNSYWKFGVNVSFYK